MPATVPCAVPVRTRCASWHPVLLGSHPPQAQGTWQLYTSQFNCAGSFTSHGERLGSCPSATFTRGTSRFLKKGRRKKLNPLAHSAVTRRSFFPRQVVGHVSIHYDFRRNTSSKKKRICQQTGNWLLSTCSYFYYINTTNIRGISFRGYFKYLLQIWPLCGMSSSALWGYIPSPNTITTTQALLPSFGPSISPQHAPS